MTRHRGQLAGFYEGHLPGVSVKKVIICFPCGCLNIPVTRFYMGHRVTLLGGGHLTGDTYINATTTTAMPVVH